MFDSVIFSTIAVSVMFGLWMVIISEPFRKFIRLCAFNGMEPASAKQFIKEKPFRKRLFMTYVWNSDETGEQHLCLARCSLVWHYFHVISYVAFLILNWRETLRYELFDSPMYQDIFIFGFQIEYGILGNLLIYIIFGAVPVYALISYPWIRKMKWDKGWHKEWYESYIDDAGKMVLRCQKYPKKGSKEWIVSEDSIEFHVIGKETRNRTFSISDITKANLKVYRIMGNGYLDFTFRVDGKTTVTPALTFDLGSIVVAEEIYDYIAGKNTNITPRSATRPTAEPNEPSATPRNGEVGGGETDGSDLCLSPADEKNVNKSASGRIILFTIGLIYIVLGIIQAVGLFNEIPAMESVPVMMIINTGLRLFVGFYGALKCNDLTKAKALRSIAIFNLFLTVGWIGSPVPVVLIIAALSVLFLIVAAKNCATYDKLQKSGIDITKPANYSKEPLHAPPLGKVLLRVTGIMLIILAVVATWQLAPNIITVGVENANTADAWFAIFFVLVTFLLSIISGILGIIKINDLNKARTLRTLAIITIILNIIFVSFVARVLHPHIMIVWLALPILFFIAAQVNYAEYKKLHQSKE